LSDGRLTSIDASGLIARVQQRFARATAGKDLHVVELR
jgi:hypothetical protein